ncbi:hypothetical protein D0439_22405 [Lysinibacillus fusiformis]|nr:hypothetical protein D0439_22405 [Lysinibacillus fusiformis]
MPAALQEALLALSPVPWLAAGWAQPRGRAGSTNTPRTAWGHETRLAQRRVAPPKPPLRVLLIPAPGRAAPKQATPPPPGMGSSSGAGAGLRGPWGPGGSPAWVRLCRARR